MQLEWTVAGSGMPQEAYWAWILCNGAVHTKQKTTTTNITMSLADIDRATYYSAVISDREDAYCSVTRNLRRMDGNIRSSSEEAFHYASSVFVPF